MNTNEEISEQEILSIFVERMETHGVTQDKFCLSINEIAERIQLKKNKSVDLDELQKLLNKCKANKCLEQNFMGSGEYDNLRLTTKGLGVFKSYQYKIELLHKPSLLQKASDFFDSIKGLFIALGSSIALFSAIITLLNYLNNLKK